MPTLKELTTELENAEEQIESLSALSLDNTSELDDKIDQIWNQIQRKLQSIDFFLDSIDVKIANNKATLKVYEDIAGKIKKKIQSLGNSKKRIMALLMDNNIVKQGQPFRTALRTYYVKKHSKIIVKDIEKLPDEYKTIKQEILPDKQKLKGLSKDSLPEGCELEETITVQRR